MRIVFICKGVFKATRLLMYQLVDYENSDTLIEGEIVFPKH